MLRDIRGVQVSTTQKTSLERLERATELTASYFVDPLAVIDQAVAGVAHIGLVEDLRPRRAGRAC